MRWTKYKSIYSVPSLSSEAAQALGTYSGDPLIRGAPVLKSTANLVAKNTSFLLSLMILEMIFSL
jgi:hypothetical protein